MESTIINDAYNHLQQVKDLLSRKEYRDAMEWCIQLLEDLSYLEREERTDKEDE